MPLPIALRGAVKGDGIEPPQATVLQNVKLTASLAARANLAACASYFSIPLPFGESGWNRTITRSSRLLIYSQRRLNQYPAHSQWLFEASISLNRTGICMVAAATSEAYAIPTNNWSPALVTIQVGPFGRQLYRLPRLLIGLTGDW